MTTLSGRIGGQYSLMLVEQDRYRIQGSLQGQLLTMWTGDYPTATKIMDYCVLHDGEAQHALSAMFREGDPTMLLELIEAAKVSTEARGMRKVSVTVEIETDVLEGESSIQLVNERLGQACNLVGVRLTLIQAYYSIPEDRTQALDLGRIARQRDLLLDHFIESEDGTFTFPDGTVFPCRKRGEPIDPQVVRAEMGQRPALQPGEADNG